MRTRTLGADGPEVSVVGLGTSNFGSRIDDYAQARAVIDAAIDNGVTLVDTADIYGYGVGEEFVGRALEGRRDRMLIATKFGMDLGDGPRVPRGSREYIRWAVERSLERLRTDVIDLYQQHEPDETTPIAETLGALDELVQEGTVRFTGSSDFSAEQLEAADRAARERGVTRFVATQNEYSLVERRIEIDVIPACERLGIGLLPYFPLAEGLLTGKHPRGATPTEGRLAGSEIPEARWERVDALRRFADDRGLSLLQVAIGGLAAMPAVASVIAGAMTPEQVRANAEAGAWEPTPDDLATLR
jgi:aryl-alcohol dehydrogenase-like predicted oxidoreductase